MVRALLRKIGWFPVLAAAALSAPVGAQMFSEGFEFLKAVKERDGDTVTDTLNKPGSVVVNTRDLSSGETALHIVTRRRDAVWIRFLTQKGANPNIADKGGVTPLVLASNLGFVDGVEALIKAGARVDVANDSGETPLIAAVHRRDVGLVRMLLANGANPDRNDNSGRSARDYADLMGANSQLVSEFVKADEERAAKGQQQTYGPSF